MRRWDERISCADWPCQWDSRIYRLSPDPEQCKGPPWSSPGWDRAGKGKETDYSCSPCHIIRSDSCIHHIHCIWPSQTDNKLLTESTEHDLSSYLNLSLFPSNYIEITDGNKEISPVISYKRKTRSESVNFLEQPRQSCASANENEGNFSAHRDQRQILLSHKNWNKKLPISLSRKSSVDYHKLSFFYLNMSYVFFEVVCLFEILSYLYYCILWSHC